MANFWDEQAKNKWYSYALIAVVVALIAALGLAVGYVVDPTFAYILLPIALVFSIFYAVGGYYYGDKVVLAATGARPAVGNELIYLNNVTEGLSLAAGIPAPKAYVINDPSPNAFATGRDPQHASIAVTTGLLQRMDRQELEGVVAHEMSHVRNLDIRFMTLTVVLVGLVSILSDLVFRSMLFGGGHNDRRDRGGGAGILTVIGIVFIILSPILAQLIKLAISRKREYLADASAAQLTRNPDGLASALEKLKTAPPMQQRSEATSALFIGDPNGGKKSLGQSISGLFSTHPPLEDRIRVLRAM